LQQVLMTYGLILVIEELRSILIGDDVHGVAVPAFLAGSIAIGNDMLYPVYRLFVSAACVVLALALYWLIRKTRVGMKIRAGASNREMAQSLGIDIGLLYRVVFSLGFGLAVMSGMLFAPVSTVYPGMGAQMLIVCFLVVVIGGIGSITGAFVAALLIGFVDTFGKVLWQEGAGIAIYLLMAVILLVRPAGLLGERATR
jgi:branched-chain amino acid transport system permease protein